MKPFLIKIKDVFGKIIYEAIISFVLILELMKNMPLSDGMSSSNTTPYLFSYKYGLNSRFLIGTIIEIVRPVLSCRALHLFIILSLLILIFMTAFYLGRVIRKSDADYKTGLIIMAAIYLASPASVSFLFYSGNFGRFDIFLILIGLFSVYLIGRPKLKYALPVICLLGMAVHQVFAFTYLIIILCLLLFDAYKNNFSKKSLLLFVVCILVSGVSFLYFQFFTPGIEFESADEFIALLAKTTNVPISKRMIEYEYFKGIGAHINDFILKDLGYRLIKIGLVLLLISPVIIVLNSVWKNAIASNHDKKLNIVLYSMRFAPVAALPAFIMATDWGRWLASVIIVQICFIFYLSYKKTEPMMHSLEILQDYFSKRKYQLYFLLIYLAALGKFQAAYQLEIATKILSLFSK